MTKIVFFAFRAEPDCFAHAILNALDLEEKALWGEIVFEGQATGLIPELARPGHFLNPLYTQAKSRGIFFGACLACSNKLGISDVIEAEKIPLIGTMSGHVPMADFIKQGYQVITL